MTTNSYRILVTGGAGTVGHGIIDILRARGHKVFSCDRSHQADEVGFSLRTDVKEPTYARCDISEYRQVERVFETFGPFDYVYHCAAELAAGTVKTSTKICGEPTRLAPST